MKVTKPVYTRSRFGCSSCKNLKIKCTEERPKCKQCAKHGYTCDYSLTLKWGNVGQTTVDIVTPDKRCGNQPIKSFCFINTTYSQKKNRKKTAATYLQSNLNEANTSKELIREEEKGPFQSTDPLKVLEVDNELNDGNLDLELFTTSEHHTESIFDPNIIFDFTKINELEIEPIYKITKNLKNLPDILLNNQYYYESFMFFCENTSKMLVSASENIYSENPFNKLLPRLAVADDSVLCLVLAFGICHRAAVLHIEQPNHIIDSLRSRSLKLFQKSLNNSNQSDDIVLSVVILLGSFDIFSASETRDWKVHVKYAKQILSKRGLTFNEIYPRFINHNKTRIESDLSLFFYRWLGYIGVISHLVSPTINSDSRYSVYSINDIPKNIDLITKKPYSEQSYERFSVDPLLGFEIRLLPIFDSIIELIKESTKTCNEMILSTAVVQNALLLENAIKQIYKEAELERKEASDQSKSLFSTNAIFCHTSLLILYRRVLFVQRKSPLIQNLCYDIKQELEENVISGSSAELCSMFCIFTASVESVEKPLQDFFNQRFSKMINLLNPCAGQKALDVIHKTWETGKNWTEVATDLMATNLAFI